MLLLDQLDKEGDIAHGRYQVKGDEWFLQGHFPGTPVVPGVILCEILAQTAGILMTESLSQDTIPLYTSLKNVRFRPLCFRGTSLRPSAGSPGPRVPFTLPKGRAMWGTPCASKQSFPSALRRKQYVFKDPDC